MANPGDLDTSFAGSGKKAINFGGIDVPRAVLVQPDGRIVVAGGGAAASSFCVARLRSTGALDTTFSGDGKKTFSWGAISRASAVLPQPNGKIPLAGFSGPEGGNVQVARLSANGALDTTFGTGGKVPVDFGGDDFGIAMARQANGRIVVAGQRTGADDFAVACLLA